MSRGIRNTVESVWDGIHVGSADECWEWQRTTSKGYGRIRMDGKFHQVHRLAYETRVGPIPAGMELDHLCRNRKCCNPRHLEPVTREVNLARSPDVIFVKRAARTHCKNGHPYEGENLFYHSTGGRQCRECSRSYARAQCARAALAEQRG